MGRIVPLNYLWDSEAGSFAVDRRFLSLARRQFIHGEVYRLEEHEVRSLKSLRHYHASIKNIWDNLPDDLVARWEKMMDDGVWNVSPASSPDLLRKWALIRCGYHRERHIVCETAKHAQQLVKNMYDDEDPFTITVIKAKAITIYRARSQSAFGAERMTHEEFKESKDKVLDLLSSLIGTKRTEVEQHVKQEAEKGRR